MSKKHPVSFVDFNTSRLAAPDGPLMIARKGGLLRPYNPSPSKLAKITKLIRLSGYGRTYPFEDGWLWEAWEAKEG